MTIQKKQIGHSLLEQLLLIALLAILLLSSYPSANALYQQYSFSKKQTGFLLFLKKTQQLSIHLEKTLQLKPLAQAWVSMDESGHIFLLFKTEKDLTIDWRGFPKQKLSPSFNAMGYLNQENGHFTLRYHDKLAILSLSKSGEIGVMETIK